MAFKFLKNAEVIEPLVIEQKSDIATIVAGFSFSMLGFLAAVITILFSFSGRLRFQKYQQAGYLDVLMWMYYSSIFSLVIAGGLSIGSFSKTYGPVFFDFMSAAFVSSIFQCIFTFWFIANISAKMMSSR